MILMDFLKSGVIIKKSEVFQFFKSGGFIASVFFISYKLEHF